MPRLACRCLTSENDLIAERRFHLPTTDGQLSGDPSQSIVYERQQVGGFLPVRFCSELWRSGYQAGCHRSVVLGIAARRSALDTGKDNGGGEGAFCFSAYGRVIAV